MKNIFYLLLCSFFLTQLSAAKKPNILFIVSEDNGPELGCYGDKYARTPTLDKLAETGLRFENAYVPYSVCSPSRAAFYTGLYAHQNGQIGLATKKFTMLRAFPWMGSYLKDAGYFTGLIGKLHVNGGKFDVDYRAIKGSAFNPPSARNGKKYAKAAMNVFTQSGDKPFFLCINYPDAHLPFHNDALGLPKIKQTPDQVRPPAYIGIDNPKLRSKVAAYYNCMARLDDHIAMLLAKLKESGKLDNTIIVYIGDHGAQLPRGKTSVYEGGVRIPLIVNWPGKVKSEVTERLASTIDILPTFLRVAGIDVPDYLPGVDLINSKGHKEIYTFTTGSAPRIYTFSMSIRDKRYKLIHNPLANVKGFKNNYATHPKHMGMFDAVDHSKIKGAKMKEVYKTWLNPPEFELYDLKADQNEFNNLAKNPEYSKKLKEMIGKLKAHQKMTKDPFTSLEACKEYHKISMELLKKGKNAIPKTYLKILDKNSPKVTQ